MYYRTKRLMSLDALRGFDMMFIMGFAAVVTAICNLFPSCSESWLATQMSHVDWNGLRHHDTIFPLFLFIAGVSFPFSYSKQLSRGTERWQIYLKIIRRGLVLVFLGLVYNGLFNLDFANLRCASVLARIGLAWMFAALLFINFRPSARAIIAVVLLVGYWLLLKFIPAPDVPGAQPYSFEGNLVGYIDRLFLPGRLLQGTFDPEGLLSCLPAIVTAMLGMFTGEFVRYDGMNDRKKVGYMFIAAVVMLVIGLLWSMDFPVNKKLWSSTFVLIVGSYSLAMFTLFYYVIDVLRITAWAFPFQVIGMNSITIYLAQRIIPFSSINKFFFAGTASLCSEAIGNLVLCIGYFVLCWLFLYFLYKKNVFLKV